MDSHEIIARGDRAAALLESELLQEIIEDMEEDYIEAWRTSDPDKPGDREIAYMAIRQLDVLRARLGALVGDADIERDNLDRQARRNKE